ncbi:MAG TPA: family 1 glycosylhydrolase [Herpetosiphonaceae bacterium]
MDYAPFPPDQFIWAGGFENTFIPQQRPQLRPLDEYALTQHYEQWRDDLGRAASLGIQALRWGVPWYRVEPQQGVFDWRWIDEVLDYMVRQLGLHPIIDLMHYGTPLWLEQGFADPRYPEYVAAYASAFVTRYQALVRWYTPLNEPTVNAEFAGRRGLWPPYLSGEAGYAAVLLQLARGIQQTAQAIRMIQPDAVLVAVEAMGWRQPLTVQAEPAVHTMDLMDFLAWDLVRGAVDEQHGLFEYLTSHGVDPDALAQLRTGAVEQDIFGVNFYPWSASRIDVGVTGEPMIQGVPRNGALLADVLRRSYGHTGCPVMVTETSAPEDITGRMTWMDETIAASLAVRAAGIPVIGYTWFPLITMINWDYRQSDLPINAHLLHLGLWDSTPDITGRLIRNETPLVAAYREHINPALPPVKPPVDGPHNSVVQTGGINFGQASVDSIGTITAITIASPSAALPPIKVPMMANHGPLEDFVMRDAEYKLLVRHLLAAAAVPGPATIAVYGLGGNGKTSLANAVCHNPQIREAYADGILWVTLGESPNVSAALAKIYAALTGLRPTFIDEEDATHSVAVLLADRHCLLVIDDAWNSVDLQPFRFGEAHCVQLITTRKTTILPPSAQRMVLEGMQASEALLLLGKSLSTADPAILQPLVAAIGQWPLLLKLANGVLHQFIANRNSLREGSDYVRAALADLGPIALDDTDARRRDHAVSLTLDASLRLLTSEQLDRYLELAIFPDDIPIPLAVLERLWARTGQLRAVAVRRLQLQLVSQSLVQEYDVQQRLLADPQPGPAIQVHDIVRKYIQQVYADRLPATHAALLASYGIDEWWHLSADAYAWHHLAHHLLGAGRKAELRTLLLDYRWIEAKLAVTDVPALLNDYALFANDQELQFIHDALQLSAYSLARDRQHLRSQLYSRLLLQESPGVVRLLDQIKSSAANGWLRTLTPSLEPIGGKEVCMLTGHIKGVTGLALFHKGQRALSVGDDGMVKVWDLASGKELRTLGRHSDEARGIAVAPGDRMAISTGGDAVLKVWDLTTGQEICTLTGHRRTVRAVTFTADGRFAISASDDWTLKIWDLTTWTNIATLEGHTQRVVDVVLIPGIDAIASAADDHTIKIWSLSERRELRTLKGHTDMVRAIAVSADGHYLVSGSDDATIRVWDWRAGCELRTLKGHTATVWCVDITPDSRHIYSGSRDGTIRAWELESGSELHTFTGHTDMVRAIKVLPDTQHILSASNDLTIRLWAMESKRELRTLVRHTTTVNMVIFTPDGSRAISASQDTTIKVWNIAEGAASHNLKGHDGAVRALCAQSNQILFSGSDDGTIRKWDLATGMTLAVLRGHLRPVTTLALLPTGCYLISGSADWSVWVWDLATDQPVASFIGESAITTCSISADGATIVVGEQFGRVHLLRLEFPPKP